MENKIECPKCSHEININEAVFHALESKLRAENAEAEAKKDAEFRYKMKEADQKLSEIEKQKEALASEIEARTKIALGIERKKIEEAAKAASKAEVVRN